MASVSQTAVASTTTDGASATFTGQAIGADGGSDILYVGAGARSTANASTMSCTIDGVAAPEVVFRSFDEGGNVRSNCGIFALARNSLPDPAQTDVDVVITHNATCIRHAAAVAVSPDASATAGATASQGNASNDLSLNTTANGIVVGFIYNGDAGTINWTGLTETSDLDVAAEGSNRFGSAYASNVSAETPRTVTAAVVTDLSAKVAAAFPVASAAATGRKPGRGLTQSPLLASRKLVA